MWGLVLTCGILGGLCAALAVLSGVGWLLMRIPPLRRAWNRWTDTLPMMWMDDGGRDD